MKPTGKMIERFSKMFDENVIIFEEKEERPNKGCSYIECDRCGKPIKRIMFVVQSKDTFVELGYFGAECVKSI